MTIHRIRLAAALGGTLILAACGQPAPSAPSTRPPDRDLVAAIRAAGEQDHSVVQVAPLRDPAVQGLLDAAHADEQAGRYADAAAKADQALKLSPEAPDLLQYRAELAVRLKDYADAERLAQRSFDLGPRLGELCARNWQTVAELRALASDGAGAAAAKRAREDCRVAGPVRM
ncbi:MAG: tetratricopeptide repeat protein [Mizugakiibacter sp.]|uniref:tetratricopeptide repeat protein n=1 Tax=Mizugakiibacter sp. TaxID=1972610 RepID=UPI0031C39508|nr:tetratricopeptide repeat protein [Xanthomonadaceae bacterium]